MYQPSFAKIDAIDPHPNADRLAIATVVGQKVIVDLATKVGDYGVFFPADGELSHDYMVANDLMPVLNEEGVRVGGGYFDHKGRVRAMRLRGVKSEGLWMPIRSFSYVGDVGPVFDKENDTDDAWLGVRSVDGIFYPICRKYETPATKQAKANAHNNAAFKGVKINFDMFKEHVDTDHFMRELDGIPFGLATITEKLHGTSGRVGKILVNKDTPLKWWQKLFGVKPKTQASWKNVIGTRHTVKYILDDGEQPAMGVSGYYMSEMFRYESVMDILSKLRKGETIYYEIVGYHALGSPIMSRHSVDNKEMKKLLGKEITYSYGQLDGHCTIYVYRITMTNEDGVSTELSWPQVKLRCAELGIKHVPELAVFYYSPLMSTEDLKNIVMRDSGDTAADGEGLVRDIFSTIADHLREGCVLRIDSDNGITRFLKQKNIFFRMCEGTKKMQDDYVDTEEAS